MSLSTPNSSTRKNSTQPLFKPPGGGDFTLRSSDGVEFLVHSTYLKLGSSVFADMMATSTRKDTVELTESAIDVSYLLRFIYPNRLPLAISLNELPNCLLVAQKYDVDGALDIIDELIATDGSPHKPLSSDPIRAYELAVQFNLPKTKVASAPLITTDRVNFCDLTKLPELARTYPPLKLIRMMNLQAMRSKVLFDVLFDFENKPMRPDHMFFDELSCAGCWPINDQHRASTETYKKFPTTWSLAWARLTYETLLVSSIEMSQSLFQATALQKFQKDDRVCQRCLSRMSDLQKILFEGWASGVREHLETQLERLELLYSV